LGVELHGAVITDQRRDGESDADILLLDVALIAAADRGAGGAGVEVTADRGAGFADEDLRPFVVRGDDVGGGEDLRLAFAGVVVRPMMPVRL